MEFKTMSTFWIITFCLISQAARNFSLNYTLLDSVNKENTNFFRGGFSSKVACFMCRAAAEFMLNAYHTQPSEECFGAIAVEFCKFFNIEDAMVCNSIIPEFKEEFMYIIGQLLLSPDQFCGFIMPESCGYPYNPASSIWNVTFPDKEKPPVTEPTLPKKDAPKLRVLHLADIHVDKLYSVGSNINCFDPLCCRTFETVDNTTFQAAGQWGSPHGRCDVPPWTLTNLFDHLKSNEKFDYILWTGDLPPHNVWNQTRNDQLSAYGALMQMFLSYFPDKVVFSAIGNHESSPVNNFAPHYKNLPKNFSISWLYDAMSEHWTHWIDKSQTDNIKKIASYVVKPFPGFRIISLNTMYCCTTNFWIYLNETDPDNALGWLIKQLQSAEDGGDKVHIIGHILPGQCMSQWSKNYYKIINRYESTVRAQFFGHTHADEFAIFYEDANYTQRATNMYYVGPSFTTFPTDSDNYGGNPAYRIYVIDGNYSNSTWRVLNHETYSLNLTEANRSNVTQWLLEYDAKTAYNLKTLFPQEWSDLIMRMKENDTLFQLYNTFYNRQPTVCGQSCKRDKLCSARSAISYHPHLCDDMPNPSTSNDYSSLWMNSDFIKIIVKKRIFFNIPDKCKPSSRTKHGNSTTSANSSVCWLLFPSSNKSRKCRDLCDAIVNSKSGSNKLFRVKNTLCRVSFDCCIHA